MSGSCQYCESETAQDDEYCSSCGEPLTIDVDEIGEDASWRPRHPVLSVFAALMFSWTALNYGGMSIILFGIPAVFILPRVRKRVVPWMRSEFNEDVTSRAWVVGVGVLYGVLLVLASMLMIGSGASMEGGSAMAGFISIVIAFVLAVVLVGVVRVGRRIWF